MATVKDNCKSNNFHQTLELHVDCGSETLRRFIQKKLDQSSYTLKEYLNIPGVKGKIVYNEYLYKEQVDLLFPKSGSEPQLSLIDISLLTFLLLYTSFSISKDERKLIKDLRKERNDLSHVPKAELDDKLRFKRASKIIIALAQCVDQNFKNEVKETVSSLERKVFVSCRSIIEIVKIRNEELLVMLIENPQASTKTVDPSDVTNVQFGLTKWAKQFTRTIDLDIFLQELKDEGVLSHNEKLEIEKEYNKEEQSSKLIMKIVDETKENIWKFCRCLRKRNNLLADLVENRNTDGTDTEKNLKDLEEERICKILKRHIVKDANGSIPSEEIHLLVEEELGYLVNFSIIMRLAKEIFHIGGETVGKCFSLQGISWDASSSLRLEGMLQLENSSGDDEVAETKIVEMSVNDFAEYMKEQIDKIKHGLGNHIEKAFEDECITPETFIKLDNNELNFLKRYMPNAIIPIGVSKKLETIQTQIKKELRKDTSDRIVKLREFDLPTQKSYFRGQVRPANGNLLVPAHAFRTVQPKLTVPHIVKECIQFIAACLNTRKNGTIHFGIQKQGQGCGFVNGIRCRSDESLERIDYEILKALDLCFDNEHKIMVKRCVRPIQIVHVEDDAFVIELDVLPHSEYTKETVFKIHFPPKGIQESKLFVLSEDIPYDLIPIPHEMEEKEMKHYSENFAKRRSLDKKSHSHEEQTKSLAVKLVERLTAGYDYVNDQYVPIICLGKISGSENEDEIREKFDIRDAFLSSPAIFDFEPTTELRKITEDQNIIFRVITADHDSTLKTDAKQIWMYCNGNLDLKKEEMNTPEWVQYRYHAVEKVLSFVREQSPHGRAMIIFIVFGKTKIKDPLFVLAEDCFKTRFNDNCQIVVIAECDEMVSGLKASLTGKYTSEEELEEMFHTGMNWLELSDTIRTVFPTSARLGYKLPRSNGHFVIMSAEEKQKLELTDIEILNGEECVEEEKKVNAETRSEREKKEQQHFYQGSDVSWWNFYYADHIGKRDLHTKYMSDVTKKLRYGTDAKVQRLQIRHQPGAGGSTAGRYVLWKLSQFNDRGVASAYRCCVVKQITEKTAEQISRFMFFKEESPNPVVILTDNESEENLGMLESSLGYQAYNKGDSKKLFCLHIAISRVPISVQETNDGGEIPVLKHLLSNTEKCWFDKKYKELQQKDFKMETLIAFNVMRESFNKKYVKELAKEILKDVKMSELDVLKCLSLINIYDSDSHIPISTFDCFTPPGLQKDAKGKYDVIELAKLGCPVGLISLPKRGHQRSGGKQLWNAEITEALALLIKYREDQGHKNGITIISQALAEEILTYIMEKEDLSLENVIDFVLTVASKHQKEKNSDSKRFVEIVKSLFKTRLSDEGETKSPFSKMILDLQERTRANSRVVSLMTTCFTITQDAMVGQQLARFLYIHMNDYDEAENVIQMSIKQQPKNSYLHDTHGQIYRSKLEKELSQKGDYISDADAVQIINIAFTAMEKFATGQSYAWQEEGNINNSCFIMEVKTAIHILDNFKKFVFYRKRPDLLLEYLNNSVLDIKGTPFEEIEKNCHLQRLKKGHPFQRNIDEALRMLEELYYQGRQYYTAHTEGGEKLLKHVQRLRENFERFYGTVMKRSKLQYLRSIGLKFLVIANEKKNSKLHECVMEARENLQQNYGHGSQRSPDKRDLLIVLGYEISRMADPMINNDTRTGTGWYQSLLGYSQQLLEIEQNAYRPYMEAYLYFAILHWPTNERFKDANGNLGNPSVYYNMLQEWEEKFQKNFKSGSLKAKTYCALGQGSIGNDVIGFEKIEIRKSVKADKFWKEPFIVEKLKRLTGRTDDGGKAVEYQIKHNIWEYKFSIRMYDPDINLSNRLVTFVLGFTWNGLVAFDVEDFGTADRNSHSKGKTAKMSGSSSSTGNTRESKNTAEILNMTSEGAVGFECPESGAEGPQSEGEDDADSSESDSNNGEDGDGHLPSSTKNTEKQPKRQMTEEGGKMKSPGNATMLSDRNPVELLHEKRKDLEYEISRAKNGDTVMTVNVDGRKFEGRHRNKKLAKRNVAKQILKALYNIQCS